MYLTINTVKILLLNNNKGEDEDDINLSSLQRFAHKEYQEESITFDNIIYPK